MGKEKYVQVLVKKLYGKGLLGKSRRRLDDSIKIDVKERGWEGED
jgi:hypothetical protein